MSKVALAKQAEANIPARESAEDTGALIAMIERAARDPNVDIEKMERLFAMKERADAGRAKADYLDDLAKMQAELPPVARRGKGHNQKSYARFEDVIEAIKPTLAKFGFSLTFRTAQDDKTMRVSTVLGHRGGHSESTEIALPHDTSGNKNPVQGWGSSASYGKRYGAVTLLGIATEDDDDGKAAGTGETISQQQAEQLIEMIESVDGNTKTFCEYFKIEKVSELPASQFNRAMTAVKKRAGQ